MVPATRKQSPRDQKRKFGGNVKLHLTMNGRQPFVIEQGMMDARQVVLIVLEKKLQVVIR
jgi:hypothetical protein